MPPTLPSAAGSAASSPAPRICKTVVVQGHASSTGTLYTLYLKVQPPSNEPWQTYDLFTDPTIEVRNAIVHRLDASGAAPALSDTAAEAAKFLGIPISIDHGLDDSLLGFDPRNRRTSGSQYLPVVNKGSDGKLTLQNAGQLSPRSKQDSPPSKVTDSYMITLELFAPPISRPPFAPFSVRLAVPFCLRNYVRLTVDIDINSYLGAGDIIVESDPGIRRVSKRRKSSRPKSSAGSRHRGSSIASLSDEEDDADLTFTASGSAEDSTSELDDFTIVGSFDACDALVIRLAGGQAGDLLLPSGSSYQSLPNALRAKQARSAITYQVDASDSLPSPRASVTNAEAGGGSSVAFEASLQLQDPFFAGLDREVQLYMLLDPQVPVVKWQPTSVDASRGILSWCLGQPILSSPPSSSQLGSSGEAKLGRSLQFDSADLLVLPDPLVRSDDDDDLLSTAPPEGMNDANLDLSLDTLAPPVAKQRRFSLQSASSTKGLPSRPSSEPSDSTTHTSNMLSVLFNLLPVLQSTEPIVITVRGTLTLSSTAGAALRCKDFSKLPKGLFAPGALAHEYQQPRVIPAETISTRSVPQAADSLEDSRETVQEPRPLGITDKIAGHAPRPMDGDASTAEILRQALAIITAHNSSLAEVNGNAMPENVHKTTGEGRSKTNWIVLTLHLLWTLFLTAMMVMLFNAGQNANHALSVKLDELTRQMEAASRITAQRSTAIVKPQAEMSSQVDTGFQNIPEQMSDPLALFADRHDIDRAEDRRPDSRIQVNEGLLKGEQPEEQEEEGDANSRLDSQALMQTDSLVSSHRKSDVVPYGLSWLADLLELPVVLLTRLIRFLVGH